MTTLKVGVLVPYSSIIQGMGNHMIDGFLTGFNTFSKDPDALQFELLQEYIAEGSIEKTTQAINKLINFNDVDFLIGNISTKVLSEVYEILKTRKALFLGQTLGEYIQIFEADAWAQMSSLNLWKADYLLGKEMATLYPGQGLLASTNYDAGYHLHEAYRQGTVSAGAKSFVYSVAPLIKDVNDFDYEPVFNAIEEHNPAFIHMLYCGRDAATFLEKYVEKGLKDKYPLSASQFFITDEVKAIIARENMSIMSSEALLESKLQQDVQWGAVISKLKQKNKGTLSPFALTGAQSGAMFANAYNTLESWPESPEELIKSLEHQSLKLPKGNVQFNSPILADDCIFTINHHKSNEVHPKNVSFNVDRGLENQLRSFLATNVSGWLNPYLCV